jgi:hypothetical protein
MRPGEFVNGIAITFSISSKQRSLRLFLGISLDKLISTSIIREKVISKKL